MNAAAFPSGLDISLCDRPQDLLALAPEWSALVDRVDSLAAFGSPRHVMASWRRWSLDPRCRLHVLAFRAGGDLAAVAPLVLRQGRAGLGSLRWMHNQTPFYTAFPCLPQHEPRVFAALGAHLQGLRGVQGLRAQWVPQGSTLDRFLTGFGSFRHGRQNRYVLPLQPPAPPLWTKSRRSDWNNRRHRLERRGALRMGMVSDPDRAVALVRWTIARKRAQLTERGKASDWVMNPGTEDWFATVIHQEVQDRRALIYELALDDQPVSTQVFLVYGDTGYMTKTAFDPQHADTAPGWNALLLCLDALREQGLKQADLMLGTYPQKLRLNPVCLPVHHHFRPLVWPPLDRTTAAMAGAGRGLLRRLRGKMP